MGGPEGQTEGLSSLSGPGEPSWCWPTDPGPLCRWEMHLIKPGRTTS